MGEGIAEVDFWRQTPAQTSLALRAIRSRRERRARLVAWHALHVNLVLAEARETGQFPSLAKVTSLATGIPEPEQPPDEQLEAARRIVRAFADLPEEGEGEGDG